MWKGRGDLRDVIPPERAPTVTVMMEEGMVDAEGHPGGGRMEVGGQGDQDHPHHPEAPTATISPSSC